MRRLSPDARHHVYRIYDADDRLIYLGATSNLTARINEHRRTKPLHGSSHPSLTIGLRMARWTATEYPTRVEAFAVQREAIRVEAPELNIYHQQERAS